MIPMSHPKTEKRIAVFAGSFDPITFGHMDAIRRASKLFDELILGVGRSHLKGPMFTWQERIELIEDACKGLPNIRVTHFEGLAVEFAKRQGAHAFVRGLRTEHDSVYEIQMAMMNRHLAPELETVFIPTSSDCSYISSTLAKDIASYGGDISKLVPPNVEKKLKERLAKGGL
jgi:pantetheine-phosphate adenylyltransferase